MAGETDGYLAATLRETRLARGSLESGSGETAGFSSVDLRIVLVPLFTKSISSLSSRLSLTCPKPNEGCSIQSCDFQFLKVCFRGIAFAVSINAVNCDAQREAGYWTTEAGVGPNVTHGVNTNPCLPHQGLSCRSLADYLIRSNIIFPRKRRSCSELHTF